jgi:hypothetical protein
MKTPRPTKTRDPFRTPSLAGSRESEQDAGYTPAVTQGREQQLADIARHSDSDAAECAAADLPREFPNRT